MITTNVRTGTTTDCSPIDSPVVITVADPVCPCSAIFRTGAPPV